MNNAYTERDWKLFRERIAGWQEAYMERLIGDYMAILTSDGNPSDRFWALERRVNADRDAAGVVVDMRRSRLVSNLAQLLREGAITEDDLDSFSDSLRERLSYVRDL